MVALVTSVSRLPMAGERLRALGIGNDAHGVGEHAFDAIERDELSPACARRTMIAGPPRVSASNACIGCPNPSSMKFVMSTMLLIDRTPALEAAREPVGTRPNANAADDPRRYRGHPSTSSIVTRRRQSHSVGDPNEC